MTAAIGAIGSLVTGFMSLSAQKKAMKASERQAAAADRRERNKLLRQAQIAQGQATNVAASVGALGSSGLIGGTSNVTNQAQSQIGYQNTSLQLTKEYNKFRQQAATYNMFGDIFGSIG
jgi:hypothetical protein